MAMPRKDGSGPKSVLVWRRRSRRPGVRARLEFLRSIRLGLREANADKQLLLISRISTKGKLLTSVSVAFTVV
jgi:hypothetical protein